MSETETDQYHSHEELRNLVDRLNALTDKWRQWQWTQARKEHEDLFGDAIQPGDEYLKRNHGPAFHEHVKLSQRSMSRMLHAFFEGNPRLQAIAEYLHQRIEKDAEQAMRKAMNSFRPRNVTRMRNTSAR